MFYRIRFDSYVGHVLKKSGLPNSESLDFWPINATPQWVAFGNERGLKPVEAAALGCAMTSADRFEADQISFRLADRIVRCSSETAVFNGARDQVVFHIDEVIIETIKSIEDDKKGPLYGHIICLPNLVDHIIFDSEKRYDLRGLRGIVEIRRSDRQRMDSAHKICRRGGSLPSVLGDFEAIGVNVERCR